IPLGTPYPEIVAGIAAMMGAPPLAGDTALLVDGAGVGRGVLDIMAREGLRPIAVTATGGVRVNGSGPLRVSVPKQDLVTGLQVLFQARRLKIAAALPHARTLLEELGAFRVQTTASGNH